MWKVTPSEEFDLIPPGWMVPRSFTAVEWIELERVDGSFDLVHVELGATFSAKRDRYRVHSLALNTDEEVAGLTSSLLRRLPVQRLLRSAVATALVVPGRSRGLDPGGVVAFYSYFHPEQISSSFDPETLDEWASEQSIADWATLDAVALVYRLAELASDSPAKAVGEVFRLHPRTASRWIKRAREKGHLGAGEGSDGLD